MVTGPVWAILIGVGLVGIVIAWRGRYRRIDVESAFCRKCAYQLATTVPLSRPETVTDRDDDDDTAGRSDAALPESPAAEPEGTTEEPVFPARCPECGADLTRAKSIMWGVREPARGRILAGSLLALGASAILIGTHLEDVTRIRWVPLLPTEFLLRTDISGGNDYGNDAVRELRLRLAAGELSPAQEQRMARLVAARARNTFEDFGRRSVAWTGSSLYLLQTHKPDAPLLDELLHFMMEDHWGGTVALLTPLDADEAVPEQAVNYFADIPVVVFGPYNQPYVPNAVYPALIAVPIEVRLTQGAREIEGTWGANGSSGSPGGDAEGDAAGDLPHVLAQPVLRAAFSAEAIDGLVDLTAEVTVRWYFVNEDLAQLMANWSVIRTSQLLAVTQLPEPPGAPPPAAALARAERSSDSTDDALTRAIEDLLDRLRRQSPLLGTTQPPIDLTLWHESTHPVRVRFAQRFTPPVESLAGPLMPLREITIPLSSAQWSRLAEVATSTVASPANVVATPDDPRNGQPGRVSP